MTSMQVTLQRGSWAPIATAALATMALPVCNALVVSLPLCNQLSSLETVWRV
jgi:hypothetical protein